MEEEPKPTKFKEPERWGWIIPERIRMSDVFEDQSPWMSKEHPAVLRSLKQKAYLQSLAASVDVNSLR